MQYDDDFKDDSLIEDSKVDIKMPAFRSSEVNTDQSPEKITSILDMMPEVSV